LCALQTHLKLRRGSYAEANRSAMFTDRSLQNEEVKEVNQEKTNNPMRLSELVKIIL